MSSNRDIKVLLFGLSTVEAIPLYHAYPGGVALRILVKPTKSIECLEDFSFEICEWIKGPQLFPDITIPSSILVRLTTAWKPSMIMIDGLEPLESLDLSIIRDTIKDKFIATRAHGYTDIPVGIDYVLVEDISRLVGLDYIRRNIIKLAEKLLERRVGFEIQVYAINPYLEELGELIEVAEIREIPIHIQVENPRGGGPVIRLYEELSKKLKYVYIHTRIYDALDTQCPNCKTILLYRSEGVLRGINISNSKCPKCGYTIRLEGSAKPKTKPTIVRLTRGRTVWYNPLMYVK
ncbi:MAG: hypothetical protein QXI24_04130 [Acidilobaceae archaeon]